MTDCEGISDCGRLDSSRIRKRFAVFGNRAGNLRNKLSNAMGQTW
jgi:hypothetical protein